MPETELTPEPVEAPSPRAERARGEAVSHGAAVRERIAALKAQRQQQPVEDTPDGA